MTSCHSTAHPLAWSSATFAPCHHSFWAHKPLLRNLRSKAKSDPFQIISCWYLHLAFWILLLYTNSDLSICQSSSQNEVFLDPLNTSLQVCEVVCPLAQFNPPDAKRLLLSGCWCLEQSRWLVSQTVCLVRGYETRNCAMYFEGGVNTQMFPKFREPPHPIGRSAGWNSANGKWRQWQHIHLG